MALRDIITAPDPRLKAKSETVAHVDDDIRRLLDDMLETMYAAPGIGLAAIQIGVPKRVIVLDIAKENEARNPIRLINPEIVAASEELQVYDEGCLSLPDQFAEVERPARVSIRHLDEQGIERTLEAEGLLAVCIQHEMDHLEGVLFVDHISRIKRDMILRKLLKVRRLKAAG